MTPQITEGDTLRLEIFQEISNVNEALGQLTGDASEVGVALSNRQVENTVVVADGETVVIGGLIENGVDQTVTKVPWLGDIPVLGWAFKSTSNSDTKKNLLLHKVIACLGMGAAFYAISFARRNFSRVASLSA